MSSSTTSPAPRPDGPRLLSAETVGELLDMSPGAVYAAASALEDWIAPAIVRLGARRIRFRSSVIYPLVEGVVASPPGRVPASKGR